MSGQRPYIPRDMPDNRRLSDSPYAPRYAAYSPDHAEPPRQATDQSYRRRRRSTDYSPTRRPRRVSKHENTHKDHSLSASIAGALAGGLLGHQAGKGDMFATAAGALVGAFGGGVVAEKHARAKNRSEDRDGDRSRRH
jgi:hypothetical protein